MRIDRFLHKILLATALGFMITEGKCSLRGKAKQLRGLGSQHLATVRVMGLETDTIKGRG